MPALLIGLALLAAGLLLYWLLVSTEGVLLGRRVVVWLYDVTAHRYDRIKQYDPADEQLLVVRPVADALGACRQPRLLDVATGTGRVPLAVAGALDEATIVGLDDAERMLAVAAGKLAPYRRRVALVEWRRGAGHLQAPTIIGRGDGFAAAGPDRAHFAQGAPFHALEF